MTPFFGSPALGLVLGCGPEASEASMESLVAHTRLSLATETIGYSAAIEIIAAM